MRVFVAGGTGVLGRATGRALREAGHHVRTTARGEEAAGLARGLGAEPLEVDLYDAGAVRRAISGSDAVLRLTTKIPSLMTMGRRGAWTETNRLRTVGARILVEAAIEERIPAYVHESVVFVYADGGAEWLDEDARTDDGGATPLREALDGEQEAVRFARAGAGGSCCASEGSTGRTHPRRSRRRSWCIGGCCPRSGGGQLHVLGLCPGRRPRRGGRARRAGGHLQRLRRRAGAARRVRAGRGPVPRGAPAVAAAGRAGADALRRGGEVLLPLAPRLEQTVQGRGRLEARRHERSGGVAADRSAVARPRVRGCRRRVTGPAGGCVRFSAQGTPRPQGIQGAIGRRRGVGTTLHAGLADIIGIGRGGGGRACRGERRSDGSSAGRIAGRRDARRCGSSGGVLGPARTRTPRVRSGCGS